MTGHLISQLVVVIAPSSTALQLMAPAVEKAILFCLIAAVPVGGCVGLMTGEFIRRAIITNKQGVKFHLLNALMGAFGFLLGAYLGFRWGPSGSVLLFALLFSAVLVLIARFCIYGLVRSATIRK